MSGKLDQSLDQIMKDTKPTGGRGRPGRAFRPRKAKAAITTLAGGVQKSKPVMKAPRGPRATAPAVQAPTSGESKIIVSNLPEDVSETQIKDYFGQTIGGIKRVTLTYGPNGRSRGIATIIFKGSDAGQKAATQLDGVKVDQKAMKIEVVLDAKRAPGAPAPKAFADRVSQPKSVAAKEKSKAKPQTNGAAATKAVDNSKRAAKKPARAAKPKKKTAEELDAEMMDYFGGEAGAANGTAQPAAATNGGDTGMVDEVL